MGMRIQLPNNKPQLALKKVPCEWLSNGVKIRKNNIKRNIFIVFLNLKKINKSLKNAYDVIITQKKSEQSQLSIYLVSIF